MSSSGVEDSVVARGDVISSFWTWFRTDEANKCMVVCYVYVYVYSGVGCKARVSRGERDGGADFASAVPKPGVPGVPACALGPQPMQLTYAH